jgi:hypothetical protein
MTMGRIRLRESEVRASRLPEVCMACGEPSDTHVKKNFSWFPPWVGITILAGLLPYMILAAVLTKRMSVSVPVCDRHRGHFWKRTLLIWMSLALWLVGSGLIFVLTMALLPPKEQDGAFGLSCFAFIGGLIAAIVVIWFAQNSGIRPKEITDRDITLIGVDDRFIDAVEDEREQRRQKRDAEDGLDDRPPPRRRAAEDDDLPRDGYREGRPRRRDDED